VCVNAYDHMISQARVLGGDGAMPLFSQASLSRVVCEAAARLVWVMDPDVGSAKRLVRGAVALYDSGEQRSKGVHALPRNLLGPGIYEQMLASCSREREDIRKLIASAGMTFGASRKGNTNARLEMQSSKVSVVTASTALTISSQGTLSKNFWTSQSIAQSYFRHRSRHTATASSGERPGRYP
jgi:hypothetical protein